MQHHALEKGHVQYNMCPAIEQRNVVFQFASGSMAKSTTTDIMPVFKHGVYRGVMNKSVVTYNCPLLFSEAKMAGWVTCMIT